MIHTVKGFGVINKTEVDVFLEPSCFFNDPTDVPMDDPLDHQKSKRVPEKHLLLLYDYAKAFDCVDHKKLWKLLKEMGIPDHLTCLLRNLYAGQEATVRTGHGTTDWFQIGKGAHQGCILSPCLFNLCAECIMRNVGLDEA